MRADCALCLALKNEVTEYLDFKYMGGMFGLVILRTKLNKGHDERIMIVANQHVKTIPRSQRDAAMQMLWNWIILNDDYDWVIMQPTHATIPDHWHLVASTLHESSATDTYQIIDTDRIEIHFKKAAGKNRK